MNGSPEKAAEPTRSAISVGSDLEDVLLGLERAQKAAYIILENLSDEYDTPRMIDYIDALYLANDRIWDERKRLESLMHECYRIGRKKHPLHHPPEKHLTIISIQERGLAYELTA